jgi:hypothetical protein
MKCYACDCILTPQEATRKFKGSKTFVDMCTPCLKTIDDEVEYTKGNVVQEEPEESEWDDR